MKIAVGHESKHEAAIAMSKAVNVVVVIPLSTGAVVVGFWLPVTVLAMREPYSAPGGKVSGSMVVLWVGC